MKGQKTGGKQKGYTAEPVKKAQELFTSILEGQVQHIETALNEVRKDDKAKYLEILAKFTPFIIAKKVDMTLNDQRIKVIPPGEK